MNESKAETKFVKLIRSSGGMALKLRHRFMSGLPDLYVKHPLHEGLFAECKYQPWPKKKDTLKLDLSPLQREFLKRCHNTGQPAVWALFTHRPYTARTSKLCVFFGADPKVEEVRLAELSDITLTFSIPSDTENFDMGPMFRHMLRTAREY